jgi:putative ABC transport system ATP-binding protein
MGVVKEELNSQASKTDQPDLLTVSQITKSYGRGQIEEQVLKGISANFGSKEFVAITGPSGSGKSTFLHLLGLMDKVTAGKILFRGKDTSTASEKEIDEIRRTQLGFIFQTFNLFSAFTARENVEFSLLGIEPENEIRAERALAALASVGMQDHANKMPKQLSGGQRQRVAIARAFVHRPCLIIADEPTASLDKQHAIEVMEILKQMYSQLGTTLILASHDQAVYSQAQRILKLEGGRFVS